MKPSTDRPMSQSVPPALGPCLLSAVCCLLSAVCCLLSAVCCLLSAVCCLLSAGCWLLAAGCWLLLSADYVYHSPFATVCHALYVAVCHLRNFQMMLEQAGMNHRVRWMYDLREPLWLLW
jgi:hypothetical protein